MANLVLHIGTPKTGTTALQKFLRDNGELLEGQGIHWFEPVKYPGVAHEVNGRFITLSTLGELRAAEGGGGDAGITEKNARLFKEMASSCDSLLVSDEWLWRYGTSVSGFWVAAKRLLEQLGITGIDVIVYLRRQDEFLRSIWNQRVKSDVKITVGLLEYARDREIECNMDYDSGIRELEEVFGKDHVSVRVYDRTRLVERDIRRDFCEYLGFVPNEGFAFRGDGESNLSIVSDNVLEIKRQANHVENYRHASNFLRGPAVRTSLLSDAAGVAVSFSPEDRQALLDRYAEGNARIARDYLGREDGRLFEPVDFSRTGGELDCGSFERDVVRFFTDALTVEHEKAEAAKREAVRAGKTVEELSTRVENLERQSGDFRKTMVKLGKRVDGLNASLGVIARLRRKRWRRREE